MHIVGSFDFIDGKRVFEDSIHSCFGTVVHEILQSYIKTLYTDGLEKADSTDLKTEFKEKLQKELTEKKVEFTDDLLMEFTIDGENILDEFSKTANRLKHFPRQKYEFVGVELPLEMDIRNNVQFVGFVDLILKDKETGKYKIYDFKTSSNGWNQYQKEDPAKLNQLILYKAFYSRIFGVPVEKIEVEFFVLKRKLYSGVSFPQSRLQIIKPNSTKKVLTETINDFVQFVDNCFNEDGTYNLTGTYLKNPGKQKKNCKYCPHHKTLCGGKEDK